MRRVRGLPLPTFSSAGKSEGKPHAMNARLRFDYTLCSQVSRQDQEVGNSDVTVAGQVSPSAGLIRLAEVCGKGQKEGEIVFDAVDAR